MNINLIALHEAVRSNNSNVVGVKGNSLDDIAAFDAEGNEVAIDVAALPAQIVAKTAEIKLMELRWERNNRLEDTDWWVFADRTPTQEQLDYRQALRDITNTYSSLDDVVWPTKP